MPLHRRIRALLLATLFLGGSFVVPVVDGAMFHSGRARAVAQVHLDSQSDQSCHAERCLLDTAIAGVGLEAARGMPLLLVTAGSVEPVLRPVVVVLSRAVSGARHSRAPPSLLA